MATFGKIGARPLVVIRPYDFGRWECCFTALTDSTLKIQRYGSYPSAEFEYSLGWDEWKTLIPDSTVVSFAQGKKAWFRAKGTNTRLSTYPVHRHSFVGTGSFTLSGHLSSLLDKNAPMDTVTASNAFCSLFWNCWSLKDVTEAILPKSIGEGVFRGLFRQTGITTFTLPAGMSFSGINYCTEMFYGCTSMQSVILNSPVGPLPSSNTYGFNTLCYGCSNLSSVIVNFTAFSSRQNTNNWMYGVSSSGTFYCPTDLGTDETISRGVNACPDNWDVVNI